VNICKLKTIEYLRSETVESTMMLLDTLNVSIVTRALYLRFLGLRKNQTQVNTLYFDLEISLVSGNIKK